MLIQSLPGQKEETDGDEVKYFSWTKIENRITKATFAVAFEDAVATMKEKLIVLKEHIFVRRIQNESYSYQKDGLTVDDLLVPVDFAENCRNSKRVLWSSELFCFYFMQLL